MRVHGLIPILLVLLSAAAARAQPSGWCRDLGGGCGYLSIRCSRLPNLGCTEFNVLAFGLGSFNPAVLFLGTRKPVPIPLGSPPGCPTGCATFLLPPFAAIPFRADRFGVATIPLPVPANPGLIGVELATQAARLDAQGCPHISNGLWFRIGQGPCR